MTNKLHPPLTVTSIEGDLMITGYTEPRPKPPFIGTIAREFKLKEWKQSKVTYPVEEGSVEPINKLAFDESEFIEGINIDQLADRLEIVNVQVFKHEFDSFPNIVEQIRLLPEKEESQEDLIDSLCDIVLKHAESHDPMDYFTDTLRIMKQDIKQKFTITKNK